MSQQGFAYLLKYIIVGDTGVGKSCIMDRFVNDKARKDYTATVGVEFGAKTIQVCNLPVKIQIWDTAGQENFRSLTRSYYKSSICALVVYDITNKNSFQDCQYWFEELNQKSCQDIQIFLIGNKKDLSNLRQISYDEGMQLANSNNAIFKEVSAQMGQNIEEIFLQSAELIINGVVKGQIPEGIIRGSYTSQNQNGKKLQFKKSGSGYDESPLPKKNKSCC